MLGIISMAALGAASGAQAADWSGPYGSLSFGIATSDGSADLSGSEGLLVETDLANGLFPLSIGDDDVAVSAAAFTGYRLQRGRLLAGLEIGLGSLGVGTRAEFARIDPQIFVGAETATTYATDFDAFASISLRAGVDRGETLIYAVAGYATARIANELTLSIENVYPRNAFGEEGRRDGYVIGFGVERRISDRLGLRGELLHFDFQDVSVTARDPSAFPGNTFTYDFDNAATVALVGVTLRF